MFLILITSGKRKYDCSVKWSLFIKVMYAPGLKYFDIYHRIKVINFFVHESLNLSLFFFFPIQQMKKVDNLNSMMVDVWSVNIKERLNQARFKIVLV